MEWKRDSRHTLQVYNISSRSVDVIVVVWLSVLQQPTYLADERGNLFIENVNYVS